MGEAKRRNKENKRAVVAVIVNSPNGSLTFSPDGCVTRLCGATIDDQEQGRALARVMTFWVQRAQETQGAAAFEAPIEHAALHEAAHCVVGAALGRWPSVTYLREDGPGRWFGETNWVGDSAWIVSHQTSPEDDWRQAAIKVAGWAAENTLPDARGASSLDELAFHHLLCDSIAFKLGVADHTKIQMASLACVRWLLGGVYRDALARVSAALLAAHRLAADELTALLAGVPLAGLNPIGDIFAVMRSPAALDGLLAKSSSASPFDASEVAHG
jgi:hypothetical protein